MKIWLELNIDVLYIRQISPGTWDIMLYPNRLHRMLKKWGFAAILTGVFTIVIFVSVEVILHYGGPYALPKDHQYVYGVQS